jgi:hypothetical protein
MKRVIAWSVCVVWEDNTEEVIDVPDWAGEDLNNYLDELQEERNKENIKIEIDDVSHINEQEGETNDSV